MILTKEQFETQWAENTLTTTDWFDTTWALFKELEEARHTRREWYQKGYNEAMKPKPKQTVVIEKWLCKSAWENYFIIEGEVEFFKTGGYDKQQVKLLDTYEVEL